MWTRLAIGARLRRLQHSLAAAIVGAQHSIVGRWLQAEKLKLAARAVDSGRLFHGVRGARDALKR